MATHNGRQAQAEWTEIWRRWIRRTAETTGEILASARGWSVRWGEPLPACMR